MCERAPISMGSKICDNCRRKLSKTPNEIHAETDLEPVLDVDSSEVDLDSSNGYVDSSTAISSLNQYLAEIGDSFHQA